MRGHFSIEWMAQSSQHNHNQNHQTQTQQPSGPAACGTDAESLPGFYSRTTTRPEAPDQQQQEDREDRGLDQDRFSLQHHSSHSHPGLEAGFSSGTEEETSGYESEGGRSLSPLAPNDCSVATTTTTSSPPPSPPAGRRPRTAFTAEQIGSLERAFKRNAYLGTQDKAELCRKLSLSDKQIRNWFQNRRMKLKRTVQDALAQACQANVASQFVHCSSPLELQSFRPRPYPRYHAAAVAAAAVAVGSQEPAAPPAPHGSAYVHHAHGLHAAAPLDAFYQYYTPYPHYY